MKMNCKNRYFEKRDFENSRDFKSFYYLKVRGTYDEL